MIQPKSHPVASPVIHPNSSPTDRDEYTHWWSMDRIASHILCLIIDTVILNSLLMSNICLSERRTACSIYAFLHQHYGSGDYNSVANIEFKLWAFSEVLSVPHRFRCIPEEWKLAEGSANTAIAVVSHSGGILAFQNWYRNVPQNSPEWNTTRIHFLELYLIYNWINMLIKN